MPNYAVCTRDCPGTCSLLVEFPDSDPAAARVRVNPEHPFLRGAGCARATALPRLFNDPSRIIHPLLRREKSGTRQRVSWDTALELAAMRIQALRDRPETMLHLRGHGFRGILADASEALFGNLGASAKRGSMCNAAGLAATRTDFGAVTHNDPRDLVNAAHIVNWGRDLGRSFARMAPYVAAARKAGAVLTTISPGGERHTSDEVLRIRPGSDRFLALAVLKLLGERDRLSQTEHAANWPAFAARLDTMTLVDLLAACDVSVMQAERLADIYGDATAPVSTLVGWGLQRYAQGGESVRHIDALAALSGQMGRSGAGVYYCVLSGRSLGTGFATVPQRAPARLFDIWDLGAQLASADPHVELVWIDGMNPVNQAPDSRATARALEAVDFVIAVDAFFNDSVERADLILPCRLPGEREDVCGSFLHACLTWGGEALPAPDETKSDYEIITRLGALLDPPVPMPTKDEALSAGLPEGVMLEELRAKGLVELPDPAVAFPDMCLSSHGGHSDDRFRLPETLTPPPTGDAEWPLRLLSLVSGRYIHSQIPEIEQQGIPPVWVHPNAPGMATLDLKRRTYLATPLGRLHVEVRLDETLHPEALVYRRGDWLKAGRGVNQLVAACATDIGNGTAYYEQRARLED